MGNYLSQRRKDRKAYRPVFLGELFAFARNTITRHPTAAFWISFLLLNLLLFLPLLLLNWDEAWLALHATATADRLAKVSAQSLVQRESLDPLRLNFELLCLVTLWATVRPLRRAAFGVLLAIVYVAALAYAVYEGITLSIWQAEPVFYTHYYLAVDGLQFLFSNLNLPLYIYVVAAGALFVSFGTVLFMLSAMTRAAGSPQLGTRSRLALVTLTFIAAGFVFSTRSTLASPTVTVSSLTAKLDRNIERSLEIYGELHASDDELIQRTYDYSTYDLAEKPDIYLIFVESYGSVLYKRDDYRRMYEELLGELEIALADDGWHTATALSEAPTWGGGSWMSYTSALFGQRIEEHPIYLALFERYQSKSYPDLGNYLKSQGYYYTRVSSLSTQLKDTVWLQYKRFFGADEWLRYNDLSYVGQRYGWGPAPPDQYVLHYAREAVTQSSDESSEKPQLLFYITQNSHYPWMPLPSQVDDWRSLNAPAPDQTATPDESIPHAQRRLNYFNAIDYQLRFLTNFIRSQEEDDAIFVLVGDHQPPRVSRKDDGWDTPMHIISRDAAFVDGFQLYGFEPGLDVDIIEPALRHEGFYSLFVRELLVNYGTDPERLPDYLPEGVVKPTSADAVE